MAKVKLNPVLEGFRGQIGDLVFKRYGEEVVVGRKPVLTGRPPTPRQAAMRERFTLATLYGRTALADPATKSLYEAKAKKKGQPVFSVIVADFYKAPVVAEIDLSGYTGRVGEPIRIVATDDFEVTSVGVRITKTDNSVVEEGPAARNGQNGSGWTYLSKTDLPAGETVSIEVTALDRPGNKGVKTQSKA